MPMFPWHPYGKPEDCVCIKCVKYANVPAFRRMIDTIANPPHMTTLRTGELLPGFADPLPNGGDGPAHIEALASLMTQSWDYPYGGDGNGIVWVGGGKYWPGIAAGIRLLRRIGCTWPVEVWYRGTCEDIDRGDVEGLGIQFIDRDQMARDRGDCRIPQGDPERGGWESKLYALTHTEFDRVLYLDADAYCVSRPSLWANLLEKAPFVYWSDIDDLTKGNVKWPHIWPAGAGPSLPVQGGQLLIDRTKCWDALVIAHWMCQHGSDHFFKHMFGDQDSWRVLIAAGKLNGWCLGPANWIHPAFVCIANGKPAVVHRCQGKTWPFGEHRKIDCAKPNPALPREEAYFHEVHSVFARKPPPPLHVM